MLKVVNFTNSATSQERTQFLTRRSDGVTYARSYPAYVDGVATDAWNDWHCTAGRDSIITEGTSGIWTYRKWSSGIAECWGEYASTAVVTLSTWGSLYAKDAAIPAQDLPFTFASVPTFSVTPKLGNSDSAAFLYTKANATTTKTPAYGMARASSSTTLKPAVDFYVIGKWK